MELGESSSGSEFFTFFGSGIHNDVDMDVVGVVSVDGVVNGIRG